MRILSALLLLSLPAAPLAAQAPGAPRTGPEIAVTGLGEARAVPDRALVTMGVESRAATAAAAARDNAARQRAILDTLRSLGFRNEQLTTANYNVRPEHEHDPRGGNPRVVGYVVGNTVQVTLENPDRAGQVIDAALAKGANMVHGLHFYLADPAPARRDAIRDAFTNARSDAEALARAAGGSLGAVVEMTTTPMADPRMMGRGVLMSTAGGGVTPIEAGQTAVTAHVAVRWTFVPGQ